MDEILLRKIIGTGLSKVNAYQERIFEGYFNRKSNSVCYKIGYGYYPRNSGVTVAINSLVISEWLMHDGLNVTYLSDNVKSTASNVTYAFEKFNKSLKIIRSGPMGHTYRQNTFGVMRGDHQLMKYKDTEINVVQDTDNHAGVRPVDILVYERHRMPKSIPDKIHDSIFLYFRPKVVILTIA